MRSRTRVSSKSLARRSSASARSSRPPIWPANIQHMAAAITVAITTEGERRQRHRRRGREPGDRLCQPVRDQDDRDREREECASSLARVVEPVNNRIGKADRPAAAIWPMPRRTKAIAVVRAIGIDDPP